MWDSNNVILLYFMTFFHRPTRLENYLTYSNLRIAKHSLQSKNKEKLLWIWKLQISNSVMVQQVKLLLATQAFHIWVSFCSTSVHLPADMPGNAEKEPNTCLGPATHVGDKVEFGILLQPSWEWAKAWRILYVYSSLCILPFTESNT